jgi:hypothetical protein
MVSEGMLKEKKRVTRFAVALGGFLIFVGSIIIGIFLISLLDVIDFSVLETEKIHSIFLGSFLMIGGVDLVAGFILLRR